MAIPLILALNVLVFVGVNASRIVFSLYALSLGANAAGVGSILAMLYVFPLVLAWPVGVMADRFGARWLLAAGIVTGGAGMAIPAVWPSLASLYVAALLEGMAIVLTTVLGQNLVGVLSRPEERTRNFSNYSLTGSTAIFLGPLLAGLVIDHASHAAACLAIAGLMGLSLLGLIIWGGVLPPARHEGDKRAGGNLLATLKDPVLRRMLAVSCIGQLGNDIFQAFTPIYAHDIGLSASVIGSLMASLAVGSFAVRLGMLALIRRFGERRLLAAAFFVGAVVFALVPFTRDAALLAPLTFTFGLSLGATQTLTMMLIFSGAPEGRGGQTVGLRLMVNNVARIAGPAVFGAIGALTTLAVAFWINAALMALAGRGTRSGR